MAKRYQPCPKPMILQKRDAGIRIILDSSAFHPPLTKGERAGDLTNLGKPFDITQDIICGSYLLPAFAFNKQAESLQYAGGFYEHDPGTN